jgi:hypothetical protein
MKTNVANVKEEKSNNAKSHNNQKCDKHVKRRRVLCEFDLKTMRKINAQQNK